MSHILKCSEWENGGKWYVSDVEDLANGSGTWWFIPNLLKISPINYVKLLINEFHVRYIKYKTSSDVLIYAFADRPAALRYKNYINKLARQQNFLIC